MTINGNLLFEDFQRTNRLVKRKLAQKKAQIDGSEYSHGQGRLLRLLAQNAGASPKELAGMMRIRPASLSELLKKLERKQYICKKINQSDRRVINYFLTPAGEDYVAEMKVLRDTFNIEVFSVLCEDEQEQFSAILNKISKSLLDND